MVKATELWLVLCERAFKKLSKYNELCPDRLKNSDTSYSQSTKKIESCGIKTYHLPQAITPTRLKPQTSGWSHLKEHSKCFRTLMNVAQID